MIAPWGLGECDGIRVQRLAIWVHLVGVVLETALLILSIEEFDKLFVLFVDLIVVKLDTFAILSSFLLIELNRFL